MEPQKPQTNDMSVEDAKASMGIATSLQDGLLAQQGQQAMAQQAAAAPGPQNEPGAEDSPENRVDVKAEISGLETRIMDELKTIKQEMKTQGDGKKEFNDLKAEIESVLNSND